MSFLNDFFALSDIWNIHRIDSFIATLTNSFHTIRNIYVCTGHIFMSLNSGYKLITFDVQPPGYRQDVGDLGCLDLPHMTQPLLDVFMSKTHNLAFIIDESGHTQVWKYDTQEYYWQVIKETDLCNVSQSRVVSVCGNDRELIWCESRRSPKTSANSYCLCRRTFHVDGGCITFDPVSALLHNSLPATLYIVGQSLFAFPRVPTSLFTCLRINTTTCMIDINSGHQRIPVDCQSTSSSFDMNLIMLTTLPKLYKFQKKNRAIFQAVADDQDGCILCIMDDGYGIRYQADDRNECVQSIELGAFNLSSTTRFCIVNKFLVLFSPDTIVLYSKYNGRDLYHVEHGGTIFLPTSVSGKPPLFPIVYTKSDILFFKHSHNQLLQKENLPFWCPNQVGDSRQEIESLCKSYILGEKSMPSTNFSDGMHFRSPALVLLTLSKLIEENFPKARKLYKQAINIYKNQPSTKNTEFNSITDAYITELFKLEKSAKEPPDIPVENNMKDVEVRNQLRELLTNCEGINVAQRQILLDDYVAHQPEKVLDFLLSLFPTDDLQLQVWSHLLINNDQYTTNIIVDFPVFHIICRLIFHLLPHMLIKFIAIVQEIHNRQSGVPIFLRRDQMVHFYTEALSCLPDASLSRHPIEAAIAKVQLILTENENNVSAALGILLRFDQWHTALELLRNHHDNSAQHLELYQTVVREMAQKQVLSNFSDDVIQLKPKNLTINAFLTGLCVSQKELGDLNLMDIMCHQNQNVSIEQMRSVLLDLSV